MLPSCFNYLEILSKDYIGDFLIFLACFFYGISFPIQRYVMLNGIGPITFSALRLSISAILILIFRPLLDINIYQLSNKKNDLFVIEPVTPVTSINNHYPTHIRSKTRAYSFDSSNKTNYVTQKGIKFESKPYQDLERSMSFVKLENFNIKKGYKNANHDKKSTEISSSEYFNLWFMGILIGLNDGIASFLQQISMQRIKGGESAFITSMYVIVVPILECIIPGFESKITYNSLIAALVSIIGVYLLSGCTQKQCLDGANGLALLIALLGMLFWSFSIMIAGKATKTVNCVDFTFILFLVSSVLCFLLAFIFEPDQFHYPYVSISDNFQWILATGLTEALACTLCNIGQKYTVDSRAALIMSLDTVVASISCYIFLGENLSLVQIIGCLLMLLSTLISVFNSKSGQNLDSSSSVDSESNELNNCNKANHHPSYSSTSISFKLFDDKVFIRVPLHENL